MDIEIRKSHKQLMKELFPHIRKYQELAHQHGIGDIFQDNGGKILQTLLVLDLTNIDSRIGNDAKDTEGNEYELKTVNILLTKSFSTHHHLNPAILKKYRAVKAWYFSIYEGIELVEIHRLLSVKIEPYFSRWETKWLETRRDINNPKIPVNFVRKNGKLVFP